MLIELKKKERNPTPPRRRRKDPSRPMISNLMTPNSPKLEIVIILKNPIPGVLKDRAPPRHLRHPRLPEAVGGRVQDKTVMMT
jgi:hypothetical protein